MPKKQTQPGSQATAPESPQPQISHVELPIDSIILSEKNPRQITPEEFERLKTAIERDPDFLFQRPPLINSIEKKGEPGDATTIEYHCYAGHMRIRAAKALGKTTIYCFVQRDVPEKLQDERMIRDNTHSGVWDVDILTSHFETPDLRDWGVRDFKFNTTVDLLASDDVTVTKETDNDKENQGGKISDDGKAQFSLIMDVDNKARLITILNEIKTKKGLQELEAALMALVGLYDLHSIQ